MTKRRLLNADSDTALSVAVKHLFRHLHEPRALRKNPLVRRFFEDPTITVSGVMRDREVCARIHRLVREAAEYCRDLDLRSGNDEHALRRYAIIKLQCLDNQPMSAVAAQLGVSLGYCYRERAQICRRVGRYLQNLGDRPPAERCPDVDDFQILVHRVLHYASFGDRKIAFRECDKLVDDAPSGYRKIEALRIQAFTAMRFGAPERAERAFSRATAISDADGTAASRQQRDAGAACLALLGTQLAYYRGSAGDALALAKQAVQRFSMLEKSGQPHLMELYAESRSELASALCNAGEWERGHDELTGAEKELARGHWSSTQLRARVLLDVWKLRTYLPLSSESWRPARKRLEGLLEAFELAYSSGSLSGATAALRILTEYYASVGNDEEMMRAARRTMLLAEKQPSERVRVQTALDLATQLLSTRHWKFARHFMPESRRLDICDSYHRQLAGYFDAAWALKLGRFREAWKLASREAHGDEYLALAARRRLVAAAAAYELNKKQDARALVEIAIPQAERFGIAALLREAYGVAAHVTGNKRYTLFAREVDQAVTA